MTRRWLELRTATPLRRELVLDPRYIVAILEQGPLEDVIGIRSTREGRHPEVDHHEQASLVVLRGGDSWAVEGSVGEILGRMRELENEHDLENEERSLLDQKRMVDFMVRNMGGL